MYADGDLGDHSPYLRYRFPYISVPEGCGFTTRLKQTEPSSWSAHILTVILLPLAVLYIKSRSYLGS